MSGYLQRIALSALKPDESIQPVLGSVFSPPQFASGPEASSVETEQPVTPATPSEFMARADPRPSLDNPSVRAFQVPEPGSKDQQPADLINNPIPTSIRSLPPGPKEKAETLIASLHPAKSGHQQEREPLKARRETAAWVPPKQVVDDQGGEMEPREAVAGQDFRKVVASTASPLTSGPDGKARIGSRRAEPAQREPDEIQPVLDSVFSPPQFASGPKAPSIETEQPVTPSAASEFMPRADPRPSLDDPSVRAFQVPEPGPKDQQPADLINNPIPTSIRSLPPGPKEKAETLIAPLHPAKSGHQQEREPLKARRETAAVVPPQQVVDGQGVEMAPGRAVASQDFRKVVPSTASPLTVGANAEKSTGFRRAEPAQREPDEIQIHIGRIEVTAVQPAAPLPAVAKPRRSALSLDEYLRRRDRRVS